MINLRKKKFFFSFVSLVEVGWILYYLRFCYITFEEEKVEKKKSRKVKSKRKKKKK